MESKAHRLIAVLVLLTACLSLPLFCLAAGDAIKQRMLERLPVISELKTQGIVGENNAGLLEFRAGNREQAGLVKAENDDRRKVYEAIARQQGVDAGLVAGRRALQIAEQAPSGTWLQKPDGSWYRK